jgi:hypothetical protein
LHDFSNIDKTLFHMGEQPSGALSKLRFKPADISALIEDLPDAMLVVEGKVTTRRKQIKSSAHDEDYIGGQQDEEYDGVHDMVQPNIKF